MTDPRLGHLRLVFWGLVLNVVDVRGGDGIDWIPDPLGWLLIAAGLVLVGRLHAVFLVGAAGAAAGVVTSWFQEFDPPGRGSVAVDSLVTTVVVFATCTGVVLLGAQDARLAAVLRWWDLVTTVILVGLLPVHLDVQGPPWQVLLAGVVAVVGFVAFVFFLVLLWRVSAAARAGRRKPVPAA